MEAFFPPSRSILSKSSSFKIRFQMIQTTTLLLSQELSSLSFTTLDLQNDQTSARRLKSKKRQQQERDSPNRISRCPSAKRKKIILHNFSNAGRSWCWLVSSRSAGSGSMGNNCIKAGSQSFIKSFPRLTPDGRRISCDRRISWASRRHFYARVQQPTGPHAR